MSLNVTSAVQPETPERSGFSQESSWVRQMSQSMLRDVVTFAALLV